MMCATEAMTHWIIEHLKIQHMSVHQSSMKARIESGHFKFQNHWLQKRTNMDLFYIRSILCTSVNDAADKCLCHLSGLRLKEWNYCHKQQCVCMLTCHCRSITPELKNAIALESNSSCMATAWKNVWKHLQNYPEFRLIPGGHSACSRELEKLTKPVGRAIAACRVRDPRASTNHWKKAILSCLCSGRKATADKSWKGEGWWPVPVHPIQVW